MSNHFENDNDNPLPDWLSGADSFGDDEPAQPVQPSEPTPDEPAPEWLSNAQPSGDWGGASGEEDLGYEEWMHQQEEANKPPPIEEEVPDWFQNVEEGAGADDSSDTGSFVPDWFMGLEEQSLEDAPDWFKDTGAVDSDSLLDTSAFETTAEAPRPTLDELAGLSQVDETPSADDEELPDWFTEESGADSSPDMEIPDLDFGAYPDAQAVDDILPDLDFGEDDADEPLVDEVDELLPDLDFGMSDMSDDSFADFAEVETPDLDFAGFDIEAEEDELPMFELEEEPEPEPAPPPAPEPELAPEDMDWLDELSFIETGILEDQAQKDAEELARQQAEEAEALAKLEADLAMLDNTQEDELDFGMADDAIADFSAVPHDVDDFLDAQDVDDELFASLEGGVSDDLSDTASAEWLEGSAPNIPTESAEDAGFGFDFSELSQSDMGFDFEKFMGKDEPDTAPEGEPDLDDVFAGSSTPGMTAPLGATAALIEEMGEANLEDLFGDLDDSVPAKPPTASMEDISLEGTSQLDLATTGELFDDFDDELFSKLEEADPGPSLAMTRDFDTGELTSGEDLDLSDLGLGPAERARAASGDAPDLERAGDQPEWIADLRPDMPVKVSAGNLEFDMQQTKIADMPDELKALRDKVAALTSQQPAEAADETSSGILAGISGLSATRVIEDVGEDFDISGTLHISDAQFGRIAILDQALAHIRQEQEIRRQEGSVRRDASEVVKAKTRAKFKIDRLLVAVLMLVVLVGPFISDALHVDNIEFPTEFSDDQMVVVDAVDEISAGDYILITFDYGPTTAYELDPLADALLRHIIKQGGIPVITSTSPLGALNSRAVMDNLRDNEDFLDVLGREDALVARTDYYTLRYVAGDAVGVRGLSSSTKVGEFLFDVDSDGEDTNLDIGTLTSDDFAFVVVIGEGVDDSRRWAEQANIEGLPKYLITTASAEPIAQSYVDIDGAVAYDGYLAGYRDARIYNALRNPEADKPADNLDDYNLPDTYIAQWYSTSLAVLAAVVIISLGLVINFVRRIGGRSK